LLIKIIHNKLQQASNHIIREDQNGFSPGRGYVDDLFIVYQVPEKRTTRRKETHMTFIEKAYDSLPRNKL
jgi:beta-galactosidase beta subunit